ncbi:Cullin binding-domain-containing protein [Apiosordaria backusii]|uniref:Defective in cullin neddylation protein n=1 Tax=Apiosordaria backusii TaxID=314023 RepID=A0AA40EFF9_9PEZI|nr:Cullin binding-domain-containing protein [Apiosordaria backusii]
MGKNRGQEGDSGRSVFRSLFASCFHKRPEQPPPKSPPSEGATETDSRDSLLHSLPNPNPAPQLSIRENPPATTKHPTTMPKAARKSKAAAKKAGAPQAAVPYRSPDSSAKGGKSKANHKSPLKYFSTHDGASSARKQEADARKKQLEALFDEFETEEDKTENHDSGDPALGADSSMRYLEAVGANPANYSLLVVCDIVKAQTIGEITKDGFVEGWNEVTETLDSAVKPELAAQKRYVESRMKQVSRDPAYYKKLYQHAFVIGKTNKAMSMDMACAMWGMLFDAEIGHEWKTANVNWLESWQKYLDEKFYAPPPNPDLPEDEANKGKWTRTVSKDLWNQTLAFANKTLQDESLSFWSEQQAWPGIIDDFVVWCREKGVVATKAKDEMEVDE